MTVTELIAKLSQFDGNAEVQIAMEVVDWGPDTTELEYDNPVVLDGDTVTCIISPQRLASQCGKYEYVGAWLHEKFTPYTEV